MQDQLQFANPFWIYAGIAVCAGLLIAFRQFERSRKAALATFASPGIVQRLLAGVSDRNRHLKRGLFVAGMAMLFLALARPQLGFRWQEVKRRGIDIVFALDTSRSMLAEDVTPNRLRRAKLGMVDFVEKLEGDRVGLIPFAGSAFTLCPLTIDYDAFRQSLDAVDTEIIPRKGTDLASAIREAGSLFEKSGNSHKFLVLITDGEDLQGEALDAAKSASDEGMNIYTVGVGGAAGELIPVRGARGQQQFLTDASGQPVRSALDEPMLRQIAQITSGLYAPFGQGAEGLQTIYREKLSLVPRDELHQRMQRIAIERFEWPLAAALLCFIARFALGDRKRIARQEPVISAGRRPTIPVNTLSLLVGASFTWLLSDNVSAAPAHAADPRVTYNDATSAYQNGDYAAAKQGLQATISTDDLALQNRAYYNLGNTLYREGSQSIQSKPDDTIARWEESLNAYGGAIALDPADADAQYNLELVRKKLDAWFSQGARISLTSKPTIEGQAFTLHNISDEPTQETRIVNGKRHRVLTWHGGLSAVKAGNYPVKIRLDATVTTRQKSASGGRRPRGTSRLPRGFGNFNSPLFDNFFNGAFDDFFAPMVEEELALTTGEHSFEIQPLPDAGRPANFSGAVGQFQINSFSLPATATTGEQEDISVTVEGSGNFDRVHCPDLTPGEGWKTYKSKSDFRARDMAGFEGRKIFALNAVPVQPGAVETGFVFAYFDPGIGGYAIAESESVPLTITGHNLAGAVAPTGVNPDSGTAAPTQADGPASSSKADNGSGELAPLKRKATRPVNLTPLYQRSWFLVLQGGLVCMIIAGVVLERVRHRTMSPEAIAERETRRNLEESLEEVEHARLKADSAAFFRSARRTLQIRAGAVNNRNPESLTGADFADGSSARQIFELADAAEYSHVSFDPELLSQWRAQLDAALTELQATPEATLHS